jgi:hypothetical protein
MPNKGRTGPNEGRTGPNKGRTWPNKGRTWPNKGRTMLNKDPISLLKVRDVYRTALMSIFLLDRTNLMDEMQNSSKRGLSEEQHMIQLIFHKYFHDHIAHFTVMEQCLAQGKANVTSCCQSKDVPGWDPARRKGSN